MLTASSAFAICIYASFACAWSTYEVEHVDGEDDSAALNAAVTDYASDSTILFKQGVTYNIFTPIVFPKFTNVEVVVEGNLTYPEDISTVQGKVGEASP